MTIMSMPWTVVRLDDWPPSAREAWRGRALVWRRSYAGDLARHYGSLLGFLIWSGFAPYPTDDAIAAYRTSVVDRLGPDAAKRRLDRLAAALAAIHPDRDFRMAVRGRLSRIRAPWASMRWRLWPATDQAAWERRCPPSWSMRHRNQIANAYGHYLGHRRTMADDGLPDARSIGAWRAALEPHVSAVTALQYLKRLAVALPIIHGDQDWTWLALEVRELTTALKPEYTKAPPSAYRTSTRRLSIPFTAWPEADRQAWHGAFAPRPEAATVDFLALAMGAIADAGVVEADVDRGDSEDADDDPDDGLPKRRFRRQKPKPPHRWAVATRRNAAESYGAYLHFLRATGRAITDGVTPEAVSEYVEEMRERVSSRTVAGRVQHLWLGMKAMHPDRDWRWLMRDADMLLAVATPTVNKLAVITPVWQIRQAGFRGMAEADLMPPGMQAAIRFQGALMVTLLSYRPVRRRNLQEMIVGEHLRLTGDRSAGRLVFAETKMGHRYEQDLPAALMPWLRRFLDTHRPLLPGAGETDALWLSRLGGQLSVQGVYRTICRTTRRLLGKQIPPHRFRDCYATSVSEDCDDLAQIDDAADLLGHRDPMSIDFYRTHALNLQAGDALAEIVEVNRVPPKRRKSERIPS